MFHRVCARFYTVGQRLNLVEGLKLAEASSGTHKSMAELFSKQKVVVVGVPGAFTPTCSNSHVPEYVALAEQLRQDAGVDQVMCVSVNDHYVMKAWQDALDPQKKLLFLADADGFFTNLIGMRLDLSAAGMGARSHRYAMVVNDGLVELEQVEPNPGKVTVSGARALLESGALTQAPVDQLNAQLAEFAEQGEVTNAMRVFWSFRTRGLQPTAQTYQAVLRAYTQANDQDGLQSFQKYMKEQGM